MALAHGAQRMLVQRVLYGLHHPSRSHYSVPAAVRQFVSVLCRSVGHRPLLPHAQRRQCSIHTSRLAARRASGCLHSCKPIAPSALRRCWAPRLDVSHRVVSHRCKTTALQPPALCMIRLQQVALLAKIDSEACRDCQVLVQHRDCKGLHLLAFCLLASFQITFRYDRVRIAEGLRRPISCSKRPRHHLHRLQGAPGCCCANLFQLRYNANHPAQHQWLRPDGGPLHAADIRQRHI